MPLQNDIVFFSNFELRIDSHQLLLAGQPVQLSSRAFGILVALVRRHGEVVGKNELMERVWPGIAVDDGTLRVHVAALRKALGDGLSGNRYIATVQGRGYRFVAPIAYPNQRFFAEPVLLPFARLPSLTSIVGREPVIQALLQQLRERRFLTILGGGGVGKTKVAISIGHMLLQDFGGDVFFFDLAAVRDPELVAHTVASAFGLVQSADPVPGLIAFLRDRPRLLILDSCEHLIEAIASLAEKLFRQTRQTVILGTSREAMRVEGESVWRLDPLEYPPDVPSMTVEQLLEFPASRLFVERAVAGGYAVITDRRDAAAVAAICRKLDGIALAIELAAGRVCALGLQQTAALISNKIELSGFRRGAVERHQTLTATLDWSFQLLLDIEKAVFARLSVFVGTFNLEAAREVAGGVGIQESEVTNTIASLVEKSLVVADHAKSATQFRMLDTTRNYALTKLTERGEFGEISRRHAAHFLGLLERKSVEPPAPDGKVFSDFWQHLGSIRAALDWGFREPEAFDIATRLAALASRLSLELSLLTECSKWSAQAIAALDEGSKGTRLEMQLQTAFGFSSIFTKGNDEQAGKALARALELAAALNDLSYEVALLCRLHLYHERIGDFRSAYEYSKRANLVALQLGDPVRIFESQIIFGTSSLHAAQFSTALENYNAALRDISSVPSTLTPHFGWLNYDLGARASRARVLWLQGFPEQAIAVARQTLEKASAFHNLVSDCIAIVWATRIFLWNDDLDDAESCVDRLLEHAEKNSLDPYHALASGLRGEILIRRKQHHAGIEQLRSALARLHSLRYELLTTSFLIAIADGLAMSGRLHEADEAIDQAIATIERNGDIYIMPEALRNKATILMAMGESRFSGAEEYLRRSSSLASKHGSLAWELRAAISLSALLSRQGRIKEAADILLPVYGRFEKGFDNADLVAASDQLRKLI
jgi:predicted ATPase/DNA-binding winged helix-turn-helix (wHTH) protein